ncbi:hypothetical protein VCSRO175_2626 [Vibrio cholerae]|nr:hypothetical protein VCSRO56_0240 [Vibrio cholerae]GHZ67328.1 hypothetical protein VCSRO175_2626 [Vibrio cholerae]GIA68973.1 hypothetical protein VCSRO4_3252 [Vibrio cholerae]
MNFADTNFSYSYTPPSFLTSKAQAVEAAIYDAKKYPQSSNTTMCQNEVLDYFKKGVPQSFSGAKNAASLSQSANHRCVGYAKR